MPLIVAAGAARSYGWRDGALRRLPARDEPRQPADQERRAAREFEALGFEEVASFRASGNVIFGAEEGDERGRADAAGSKRGSARRSATRCRSSCAAPPRCGRSRLTSRSTPSWSRRRRASSRSRCCARKPTRGRAQEGARAGDRRRPPGDRGPRALLAAQRRHLRLRARPEGDRRRARAWHDAHHGHDRPDRRQALRRLTRPRLARYMTVNAARVGLESARGRAAMLDVGADRADLLGQLGELDVGDELQRLAQRAEEVVVVGGDDDPRVEAGEDALPVVVGEAAAGDAGEEDVDAALADRVVDQVGAALVVEAQSRRPRSRCPRPGRSGRRPARARRGARRSVRRRRGPRGRAAASSGRWA